MAQDFAQLFAQALQQRAPIELSLRAEDTNAWRLFHGSIEGYPGFTVDRYGCYLLAMLFRGELPYGAVETLSEYARAQGLYLVIWARRERGNSQIIYSELPQDETASSTCRKTETASSTCREDKTASSTCRECETAPATRRDDEKAPSTCREQGQLFAVSPETAGKDPYLFLDFRAGRRWLRQNAAENQRVLNLFAYTCTAGVAASVRGAQITNVDFARRNLEIGRRNAQLNDLSSKRFRIWQEDVFPIIRQLAGLGVRGRAAQRQYMRVEPSQFDIIVLDPPTVANSPFGKVDLRGDYPSLLKPCLLSLKPGGKILATNHHSEVTWSEWAAVLCRTCEKCNLGTPGLERIYPDADFPTSDGEQPLKMAVLSLP